MSKSTSPSRLCVVDGKPGYRRAKTCAGWWCSACYEWARTHDWTDPATRQMKRRVGDVMQELTAAAHATTDQCIILTGYASRPRVRNYGRLATEAKAVHASRAVWIIAHGDPGERHVLHTCHRGEEGCINIRHLTLGDSDQNVQDMVGADRHSRGTRRWSAKLEDADVAKMRTEYAAGGSPTRPWVPASACLSRRPTAL